MLYHFFRSKNERNKENDIAINTQKHSYCIEIFDVLNRKKQQVEKEMDTITKTTIAAMCCVLCYNADCMRRQAGTMSFRDASEAAAQLLEHERAKHAEWKARAIALEQQIDAILAQLGQAGVDWTNNSTPQQVANAIGAINLIQGLQQVSTTKQEHIEDLQNLVRDVITGLEERAGNEKEATIRTLYGKLVEKIRQGLQATEAPYK
jgi:hypothetical protein